MQQIIELLEAVKKMRSLQRDYFETRDFTILKKLTSQERFVDRLILELDEVALFSGRLPIK